MYHPVHALVPLLVYSRCQRGVTQGAVCLNSCPRPCKNRFELQPIGGRSDWCAAVNLVLLKKHGQIILLEGSRAEPGCLGHAGTSFSSGRSGAGAHLVLHFESGATRAIGELVSFASYYTRNISRQTQESIQEGFWNFPVGISFRYCCFL